MTLKTLTIKLIFFLIAALIINTAFLFIDLDRQYILLIQIPVLISLFAFIFSEIFGSYRNTIKILADKKKNGKKVFSDIIHYVENMDIITTNEQKERSILEQKIIVMRKELTHNSILSKKEIENYKIELKSLIIPILSVFCFKEDNMTTAERMSKILTDLYSSIEKIVVKMKYQSELLSLTFDAFDMTALSLEKVDKIIENAKSLSKDLTSKNSSGMEAIKNTKASMENILVYSEQMVNIITTIEEIAQKTNLLSINASIESTHAGKTGKGFAIIAKEIRKLAADTHKSSIEIKEMIKDISQKIRDQSVLIEIAYKLFTEIDTYINETKNINKDIYKISKKGVIQSKEIQTAVNSLNSTAKTIVTSSNKELFQVNEVMIILNSFKKIFDSYGINDMVIKLLENKKQDTTDNREYNNEKQENINS